MQEIKQVIVMRKDLNMRKGKIAAQASHASLGSLLKFFNKETKDNKTTYSCSFDKDSILDKWLNGIFTKICLYVESEEELLKIYEKVENAKIPCALITDAGLTEFHNQPTITCLGIGPFYASEIDKITGDLKLF